MNAKEHPMKPAALLAASLALALSLLSGCATRTGMGYIEIENDQSEYGGKADPIYVDPRLAVEQNEYRRSYLNDGSNIRQKIVIRGPIMIVPAPPPPGAGGATTRPTTGAASAAR
jgi:hypothetical protein